MEIHKPCQLVDGGSFLGGSKRKFQAFLRLSQFDIGSPEFPVFLLFGYASEDIDQQQFQNEKWQKPYLQAQNYPRLNIA